ncbi:phosphotransferase family protein [Aliidiomarina indica]|uniref:phosphotransferase family protein n=1 Tax=Aliidiomarina indica TaxID=2749147 RepID=UPI00189063CD|nr:phosphotransferase family protein [Aliidiomarina indica]
MSNKKASAVIDRGVEVRAEEQFDLDAVDQWIKQRRPDITGQPELTQFPGGASNWTYRLAYTNADLILRRPPAGTKAKSAHNMQREHDLQLMLKKHYPVVPKMVGYCEDTSLIGVDFYVMERIEGIIPRKNMPRELNLSEAQVRQLCTAMIDQLIALHQVNYVAAGLESMGKGGGYIERQVEGWIGRYDKAKTWNVPSAKGIKRWLRENKPTQERLCLTHNDFRFDNLILNPEDPTEILAVLDWELATIGDPLVELGNMLAYWVQADDDRIAQATRRQPTHLKGMFSRQEVIDYYCEQMGIKNVDMTFYEVFGLFRLSVIAQQIYYRYHHKQTRNPAFKNFWLIVHYLHWRCKRLIKQRRRER